MIKMNFKLVNSFKFYFLLYLVIPSIIYVIFANRDIFRDRLLIMSIYSIISIPLGYHISKNIQPQYKEKIKVKSFFNSFIPSAILMTLVLSNITDRFSIYGVLVLIWFPVTIISGIFYYLGYSFGLNKESGQKLNITSNITIPKKDMEKKDMTIGTFVKINKSLMVIIFLFLLIVVSPNFLDNTKTNDLQYNIEVMESMLQESNPELCKQIKTKFYSDMKNHCYNLYISSSSSSEYCNKLSGNYKEKCLVEFGEQTETILKEHEISYDTSGYYNYMEGNRFSPNKLIEVGIDTNGNGLYEIINYKFTMDFKDSGLYTFILSQGSGYGQISIQALEKQVEKGVQTFSIPFIAQINFKGGKDKQYPLQLRVNSGSGDLLMRMSDFVTVGPYPNLEPKVIVGNIFPKKRPFAVNLELFLVFLIVSLTFIYFYEIKRKKLSISQFINNLWDLVYLKLKKLDGKKKVGKYWFRYDTIYLSIVYSILALFLFLFYLYQWDFHFGEKFNSALAPTILALTVLFSIILIALILIIRTWITKEKKPNVIAFIFSNSIVFILLAILTFIEEISSGGWGFAFLIYGLSIFPPLFIGFIALCNLDKIFKNIGKIFLSKLFYKILVVIIILAILSLFGFIIVKYHFL